jgi:hypothetical protein
MNRIMKTVVEIIEIFKGEGYIYEFCIKDGALYCNSTDRKYIPGELNIDKSERYEGDSDPSDSTIVYALAASDGSKGILIDSYGVYSEPKLSKLITDIPVSKVHNLQVS